jgi:hypothetical protein
MLLRYSWPWVSESLYCSMSICLISNVLLLIDNGNGENKSYRIQGPTPNKIFRDLVVVSMLRYPFNAHGEGQPCIWHHLPLRKRHKGSLGIWWRPYTSLDILLKSIYIGWWNAISFGVQKKTSSSSLPWFAVLTTRSTRSHGIKSVCIRQRSCMEPFIQ